MGWGPKAPDMSAANRATDAATEITQEQWDWYQQEIAPRTLKNMDEQTAISRDQYNLAKEAQEYGLSTARKYDDRYWNAQVPLENALIRQAGDFDSGKWADMQKSLAAGDVNQAFSNAEDTAFRNMSRIGANPSDGASFAMRSQMARDKALAQVNANAKINLAADQLGWDRKTAVAALGRGLPGFSTGSNSAAQGWAGTGMNASGLAGASIGLAGGLNNSTANGASAGYLGAGRNYIETGIQSAKTPGFDALMGLAAGGMKLAGSTYGGKGWTF